MTSALLLLVLSAQADPLPLGVAATDILLLCDGTHNSGLCGREGYWNQFKEAHTDAGLQLTLATDMPEDLSHYRTMWIAFPDHTYSQGEVDRLHEFLLRGRRLVLMGEYHTYDGANIVQNELLAALDVKARFHDRSVMTGCGATATRVKEHRYTKGWTTYDYGDSTTIEGGTPLVTTEEGTLIAWDRPGPNGPPNGEVILIGDTSGLTNDCTDRGQPWAHNQTFIVNLAR